jgi:hypothetical protein
MGVRVSAKMSVRVSARISIRVNVRMSVIVGVSISIKVSVRTSFFNGDIVYYHIQCKHHHHYSDITNHIDLNNKIFDEFSGSDRYISGRDIDRF